MQNSNKSLDYQSLKQELDEIVIKLQDKDSSIDESLELYQKGVKITARLVDYLQKAENKLTKISVQFEDKE